MFNYFDEKTPWDVREQILRYNATSNMTDTERARFFKLPKGCRIREGAKIISPEKLKIGINCWIGENAILDASGGLEIGSNVTIGLSVYVWTHDSFLLNIKGRNTRGHSNEILRKKTIIGDNCFIAGPSVIMPGVNIGNKCVISPMSVVYEDLPDNKLYAPYRDFYGLTKEINKKYVKMLNDFESRLKLLEKKSR